MGTKRTFFLNYDDIAAALAQYIEHETNIAAEECSFVLIPSANRGGTITYDAARVEVITNER